MNRRMNRVSQYEGRWSSSWSTLSVGIVISLASYSRLFSRIWVGSMGRNFRKMEAPAALNMLPKFDDVPISTYLMVLEKMRRPYGVGEDAPAFHHSFGQHAQILLEHHDVGGVLGHVGGRVHRDAHVRVVQRHGVVHPVPQEGHVGSQ